MQTKVKVYTSVETSAKKFTKKGYYLNSDEVLNCINQSIMFVLYVDNFGGGYNIMHSRSSIQICRYKNKLNMRNLMGELLVMLVDEKFNDLSVSFEDFERLTNENLLEK